MVHPDSTAASCVICVKLLLLHCQVATRDSNAHTGNLDSSITISIISSASGTCHGAGLCRAVALTLVMVTCAVPVQIESKAQVAKRRRESQQEFLYTIPVTPQVRRGVFVAPGPGGGQNGWGLGVGSCSAYNSHTKGAQ